MLPAGGYSLPHDIFCSMGIISRLHRKKHRLAMREKTDNKPLKLLTIRYA